MLLEINLPKYDSISDDDESNLDMRLFEDITSASIPDQQQIYFPDKWCKSQDLPCTSSSSSMEEMINKLSATMIRTAKTRGLQSNHILPDLIRRGAQLTTRKGETRRLTRPKETTLVGTPNYSGRPGREKIMIHSRSIRSLKLYDC